MLVVKSIHFRCGDGRIGCDKLQMVGELMPFIVNRLFALFSFPHEKLFAEGKVIDVKVLENVAFDVSVERLDEKGELWVVVKEMAKELPLWGWDAMV